MKRLLLIPVLCLVSCATRPHTYAPPSSSKLKASTQRVFVAVNKAHVHANEAKTKVDEAAQIAKEVQKETAQLKDVPPSVLEGFANLELKLNETTQVQAQLESDLREADAAKAEVEKDKQAYFNSAQGLADSATQERESRIKAEKVASYYRWHFWLSWIVLGLGILACVFVAFLKFTGRLVIGGMKL